MARYEVLWSDGNAAASRGMSSDGYKRTHITADSESDMWKLAYLLRWAQLLRSASMKNLKSIQDYLMDDWGYEEEELQDVFEKNDFKEEDLDSINLDGIDGGEPWIMSITLNGKKIYSDGEYYAEEDDNEDW